MRHKHINLLLVSALCAALQSLSAQTTGPLSLTDAIQYAYDHNPNMRVAQLMITDAEWRIKENTSTALPQVTAGVTYSGFIQRGGIPSSALSFGSGGGGGIPQSVEDNFTDGQVDALGDLLGSLFQADPDAKIYFSPVHSVSGNLSVNQLIFSNSYRLSKRAARLYREYVKDQYAVTRQTVRNQVVDAYLPALLLSDNMTTLDRNIGNLEKLLSDTKEINKAGFAEQLDVDRLDLSLTTLRSERSNLVRQREVVINALKLAIGLPVSASLEVSDNVDKLMTEYATADLSSPLNPMKRPEYTNLLKGRELQVLQGELYNRAWLPNVSAFLQYQPGFQGGFGAKNDAGHNKWYFIANTVGGVSVTSTLYDSGGNKAHKQRAMIALQTIDAQKELLENALNLELENSRKSYVNAQERVANQRKNLDLAQRIYDTTQKKYKAGIGSSFEVTQAEQSLYTAQQALMQAQYDLLSANVAVRKALGAE